MPVEPDAKQSKLLKRHKFLVICTLGHMGYLTGGEILELNFRCKEWAKYKNKEGEVKIRTCMCKLTPLSSKEIEDAEDAQSGKDG